MTKEVFILKKARIVSIVLASTMLLAGCSSSGNKGEPVLSHSSNSGITLAQLKQKYGSLDDKAIMPLYNVAPDKTFSFSFKSDMSQLNPDDVISVHTDVKAQPESKIIASVLPTNFHSGKPTTIDVEPSIGVLQTEQTTDQMEHAGRSWGKAPIYYIRVNYDMNASTPTKLSKPMIIPFTVQSKIPVPTLKYDIDTEGRLKLTWSPVTGATKYRIYNLSSFHDLINNTNTPMNEAENGYRGVYPQLVAEVTQTEFQDWFQDGKNGLGYLTADKSVIGFENYGVHGDYFITAVNGNDESNASNLVSSTQLATQLPAEYAKGTDLENTTYHGLSEIPRNVDVKMIDGTIKSFWVNYNTKGLTPDELGYTEIPFTVVGAALKGVIQADKMTAQDLQKLQSGNKVNKTATDVAPNNNTSYVPPANVPTVIKDDHSKGASSTPNNDSSNTSSNSVVDTQKDNTQKTVDNANKQDVPAAPQDVKISATSAFQEYLARNLIAGKADISMAGFPESQNFDTLTEELQQVTYQNPLILGVKSWDYDYNKLILHVTYSVPQDKMQSEQNEIVSAAKSAVSQVIKNGMTDDQKREAIYGYLSDNAKYDTAALKAAEANGYKDPGAQYADSFTAYGIMVKKVGVCISYAESYKLLSDLAGLKSVVVTGKLDGVGHAWNKVQIGDSWYNVDVTNNDGANSAGFRLDYNGSDKEAQAVGEVQTNEFWAGNEVHQFDSADDSKDYYVVNHLKAQNVSDLAQMFSTELKAHHKTLAVRLGFTASKEDIMQAAEQAFKSEAPSKMQTAQGGLMGDIAIFYPDGAPQQ